MIKPISEHEAKRLRERLSTPEERLVIFPELDEYDSWIIKVSNFILSRDEEVEFGVEKYRGDLEFFNIESSQLYLLMFMSKFVPSELVFFGIDWTISISSYPEAEYASNLEHSLRLYGTASVLGKRDGEVKFGAPLSESRIAR
jgi:hypothetical protein